VELEEVLSKCDTRDGLALKIRLAEGGDSAELAGNDPYGMAF
jgi:twitching motility protein PilU